MAGVETLAKATADKIEKRIIAGRFKPGEQIPTEQELMVKFDVSRSTLREAVKVLVSKGILEIRRGTGTFVCMMPGVSEDPLGLNFMNEPGLNGYLFEARRIFEPEISRLAAQRADPDEIELLGSIADEIDVLDTQLSGQETPEELINQIADKDMAFHILLCKMSKNPVLDRLVPVIIQSVLKSYVVDTFRNRLSREPRVSTHKKIYLALQSRDGDLAYQLTQQHLRNKVV